MDMLEGQIGFLQRPQWFAILYPQFEQGEAEMSLGGYPNMVGRRGGFFFTWQLAGKSGGIRIAPLHDRMRSEGSLSEVDEPRAKNVGEDGTQEREPV